MVYGLKPGTRDALFVRIVDAVDRIRDIYRKLKRATLGMGAVSYKTCSKQRSV